MHPPLLPLVLFLATYAGLAAGRLPGLALDRTGVAVLGGLAFVATGIVPLEAARAAVDVPTLAVLFGMMLLSAQYRLAGLYTAIGRRLGRTRDPRRLLLGVVVITALLSAVLTNDVTCFALTPVVAVSALGARQDAVPYLLAIACASNVGSALTPIGNPQNILIAQRMGLPMGPFVAACALPVAAALAVTYLLLRRRLRPLPAVPSEPPLPGPAEPPLPADVPLDRWQAGKALLLTVAAIALFLSPVPAPLTALGLAGVVLTSRRMHSRDMLGLVDWQLLALFVGLFVVVRGLELSGWMEAAGLALASAGADLARPAVHLPAVAVAGNLVGNVPAVMLLLPFVPSSPEAGHGLALVSTLAGNALLPGSVANIIVAEQARRAGVEIDFLTHLRVGLPVTAVSLAIAGLAVALGLT